MTNITGRLAIMEHCGVDPLRPLLIVDKHAMFGQFDHFGKGTIYVWPARKCWVWNFGS